MTKIVVFATFYPKIGKNNQVKKIIQNMVTPTRNEEGNECYNFYESKNSERKNVSFHLFEIYKDRTSLDYHKNTAYYKNYRSKIEALLTKPIDVKVLTSID